MDFAPRLSTWLPSEHLACGCWNSPRPSRPSPSPADPQGNTRCSPPSCVTTIEEHPSWTLRLPRRAVCLPPDLDPFFPPLPVGPLEPRSGRPLLKIRSRRFRPASVLPEPTQPRDPKDSPRTRHHHVLRVCFRPRGFSPPRRFGICSARGMLHPSRTGFASFRARVPTLAVPSTPTPETRISVSLPRTPGRRPSRATPLTKGRILWTSCRSRIEGRRTSRNRRNGFVSKKTCHVAFPDARAPFEEHHPHPAVSRHRDRGPSCRSRAPREVFARLQGVAPSGGPDSRPALPRAC
jgi:hypothetical protein